jgi:hypothetical protein
MDIRRRTRKTRTIEVQELKDYINAKLARPLISQDEKRAMCTVLEGVLMATRNYHGFNYIQWLDGGREQWIEAGKDPDRIGEFLGPEYDRHYY